MASSMETEPRSPSRPFIDANATCCECECDLHGFSNSLYESRDITGLTPFLSLQEKDKEGWRRKAGRKEGGISDLLLGGWRVFRRIPQQYPARPSPFAAAFMLRGPRRTATATTPHAGGELLEEVSPRRRSSLPAERES